MPHCVACGPEGQSCLWCCRIFRKPFYFWWEPKRTGVTSRWTWRWRFQTGSNTEFIGGWVVTGYLGIVQDIVSTILRHPDFRFLSCRLFQDAAVNSYFQQRQIEISGINIGLHLAPTGTGGPKPGSICLGKPACILGVNNPVCYFPCPSLICISCRMFCFNEHVLKLECAFFHFSGFARRRVVFCRFESLMKMTIIAKCCHSSGVITNTWLANHPFSWAYLSCQ